MSPRALPDYFEPVNETQSLPDYFEPIEAEEKEPNVLSKAVSYLKHPSPFDVTKALTPGDLIKIPKDIKDETRVDTNVLGFDQDKWSDIASKLPESWHGLPIRYPAAFAGSLAGTFLESLSAPENIVAMGSGSLAKSGAKVLERELPVRQVDRRINPLRNTTPQQDAIAIALTRKDVPRTPANIAAETGIPKASVRRTISEINKKTGKAEAPSEDVATKVSDFIKQNPEAKVEDIEEFVNSVPERPTPKEAVKTLEGEPQVKKPFVNPFEKKAIEVKAAEEKPTAVFKGIQPGFEDLPEVPLFNIIGGPNHGDTVSAQTLEKMGIKIPSIEEKPLPVRSPNLATEHFPKSEIRQPTIKAKPTEDELYNMAREKFNMGKDLPQTKQEPQLGRIQKMLGVEKISDATVKDLEDVYDITKGSIDPAERKAATILKSFIDAKKGKIQPKAEAQKLPEYFKPIEEDKVLETVKPEIETPTEIPKELSTQKLSDRTITRIQKFENDAIARIKKRGTFSGTRLGAGLPADDLADLSIIGASKIAKGAIKFADWSVEMIKDFGEAIKPYLNTIFKAAQSRHEKFASVDAALTSKTTRNPRLVEDTLKSLFNTLVEQKGLTAEQQAINVAERAKRFARSAAVKESGTAGAAKSLAAMRGEFEKVEPAEALGLKASQVDALFNVIKKGSISEAEKVRARASLFKVLNGEVLQPNQAEILDIVFGKHLRNIGGPGASGGYDIPSEAKSALTDYISKNPTAGVKDIKQFINSMKQPKTAVSSFMEAATKPHVAAKLAKVANTMKAFMYSSDLSFGLRQGIGMAHKAEWRNAMVEQLKYFAKPEYFRAAMDAIEEHLKFPVAIESGLFISKPGGLMRGEEAFMDNYVGKIPMGAKGLFSRNIVDASERAYIGGLNKLRMDVYDNLTTLAKSLKLDISDNEATQISRNIAKYINVFTGRGNLRELEKIKGVMNFIFGSPRMVSSRITALNPKFYMDLDPFTRKEALKSLLAMASASTTLNALGALAGGTVGYNILSSDFAKTRFPSGNVLDPSGSFQQPVVAAARMINELNRMAHGRKRGYGDQSIPQIAGNFLTSKFSPIMSLAYDVASAKEFTDYHGGFVNRFGQNKNILSETAKRFVSIFSQDMYNLMLSDPSFAEAVGLPPLMLLGAGAQNYPEKKEKPKLLLRKLR